jgi:adenine/guanine phosphoribosyltransferase-like PRPP-binding protein
MLTLTAMVTERPSELVSHPVAIGKVAEALLEATAGCKYDIMCGVPLTALPFATLMSAKSGTPMIMKRKEVKAYVSFATLVSDTPPRLLLEVCVHSPMHSLPALSPPLPSQHC